ncbi:histidine phosphatase family protein [Acidithiobacillus montserratensis]|uniref:Histidine phosphatase family protein n=1 Tax=Acidithiobacillus montserratensis TaxID=2729135 RepID=A0ACD5HBR6_9PROT|nr:histidine phosphatase family protein [Acidithiobacillaceae bacterium]MBU2748269.1 histidine phosphatase family protein [Acidithiobacillus montserratensis]
MNLILVRHAEAEDAAVSGSDFTRKLTAHGQQSATDVARALRHCLSGSVLVWSSPLLRTRETAEYIARALATPVSQYHEAIPAGDLNALSHDWQALPELPDTLIVVGHQPHLGIWTTRITHISVPIKKASVTGIHLPNANRLEGELQWYALPEMLSKMVPAIRL